LELVTAQADEIARLSAKVVELTGRLADLEQRIGRNRVTPRCRRQRKASESRTAWRARNEKLRGAAKESNPVPPGKPRPGARSR